MIRPFISVLLPLIALACNSAAPERPDISLSSDDLKSGFEFLTTETQALQHDTFSNPGYLWVEKGAALFDAQSGSASCRSCHSNAAEEFLSLANKYPGFDAKTGRLINLEDRINLCRTRHQELEALDYESDDLLALTTYVGSLGRDQTIDFKVTDDLAPHFENGKNYFYTRRGQLNLSCHQCHDQNWGRKMRGDTVSQGHINGFPTYRNDWQTLGSSHRRFEACDIGVRAEPLPLGSQTYIDLEVYLKARGNGLAVETPSIRR